MILRNYRPEDANTIVKWINDERSFRQWCADRYPNFPICAEDINSYYNEFGSNSYIFTAVDEFDNIIGHFTIRYPEIDNKKVVRLGFVIIDNRLRGQGLGKQMINCAIDYAFNNLKADKLTLGVFENNINAFKCYKSCGFIENGLTEQYNCSNEIWNTIEMYIKI